MSSIPLIGGLIGGGSKPAALPEVQPLPEAPDRASVAKEAAAKNKEEDRKRRGKRSTILSDSDLEQGTARRRSLLGAR
jgi:hypothetical protein